MVNNISENPNPTCSVMVEVEKSSMSEKWIANNSGSVWGHPKPYKTIQIREYCELFQNWLDNALGRRFCFGCSHVLKDTGNSLHYSALEY